ncbi:Molybdopterin-guanine dinucleotide biosynthesis protein MobB [hydrothermal vent metagenome]|uniref:Molybdopterin-guanine dinucleotide biosynthesis protein MobB n=1 Tax=hydrothermal vent metagenome TaxID=652676 RepID=A0A3B0X8W4_9ZZZZ
MSNPARISYRKPLLGFAAYSGTGKTTLLVKLIPELKKRGLRMAVIKHAHHNFDVDKPGKDSYELRKAGAAPMLISSAKRTVIMIDHEVQAEPELQNLLAYIPAESIDMVLVEGFRQWPFAKIELHRATTAKPLMYPDDENIIAIAHDGENGSLKTALPQLNLNRVEEIADFIMKFKQQASE